MYHCIIERWREKTRKKKVEEFVHDDSEKTYCKVTEAVETVIEHDQNLVGIELSLAEILIAHLLPTKYESLLTTTALTKNFQTCFLVDTHMLTYI